MAGGVAADLLRPALPVTLRADACWAELDPFALEPSGGIEALEDDRRRWWAGLKGCCAVLIAARPKALAGTTVMALVERKALPSAGENMASGGGVGGVRMLVVVLVVDCLVGCGSICCKASRFAARVH